MQTVECRPYHLNILLVTVVEAISENRVIGIRIDLRPLLHDAQLLVEFPSQAKVSLHG